MTDEQIEAIIDKKITEKVPTGIQTPLTQETISLEHKEIVVDIQHKGQEIVKTSTDVAAGKVLYCAKEDLSKDENGQPKEKFTWTELTKALSENGWSISKGTLSNTISDLVGQGRLIKLTDGYRLPTKVRFEIIKQEA